MSEPPLPDHPIKIYRRLKGLSMDALAQRAGTTKGHLSKIEAGILEPQLELLRRLIDATDREVTAEAIVWWQSSRSSSSSAAA